MRTVRDILNSKTKSFNIISQEETVYNALQMLNSVNLSYLVVMGLQSQSNFKRTAQFGYKSKGDHECGYTHCELK
jgi:hypothetical protein